MGDVKGMNKVGYYYENGIGVENDKKRHSNTIIKPQRWVTLKE